MTCPLNCTGGEALSEPRGRCSLNKQCICKEGYSGLACEQECPSRCFGHGECVEGECQCRAGYAGADCSELAPLAIGEVLIGSLDGSSPLFLVIVVALGVGLSFCLFGYAFNRLQGRSGTSAVPLWDHYSNQWRNAPLFEPIFAVAASTQMPSQPSKMPYM
jgi:hypothetical protein